MSSNMSYMDSSSYRLAFASLLSAGHFYVRSQ